VHVNEAQLYHCVCTLSLSLRTGLWSGSERPPRLESSRDLGTAVATESKGRRADDQRVSLGRLRPRRQQRRARPPLHGRRLSLARRIHQLWCLRARILLPRRRPPPPTKMAWCRTTALDLSKPLRRVWRRFFLFDEYECGDVNFAWEHEATSSLSRMCARRVSVKMTALTRLRHGRCTCPYCACVALAPYSGVFLPCVHDHGARPQLVKLLEL
jgi:hypothetical protein